MIPILADAGVPMLFLEFPAMLYALVPVIAVEILVARKIMRIEPRRSMKAIVTANIASTLLGFPLLWILLVGIELLIALLSGGASALGIQSFWARVYAVTVQAPWLIPYEENLKWMVPVAAAYLLIPAFFVSVFVERWICKMFWRDQEQEEIRRFSWMAHFASYAVLIVMAAIYYGIILRKG